MYLPADHQLAEQIKDNKQIHIAFVSFNLGEIGHPFFLRLLRMEITL